MMMLIIFKDATDLLLDNFDEKSKHGKTLTAGCNPLFHTDFYSVLIIVEFPHYAVSQLS